MRPIAQPHEPPCPCDAFCVAAEVAVFVCVTEPPSPGLSTRIETAVFDRWSWTAPDAAPAVWPVSADCFAVWTPVPLQPHGAAAASCEPVWFVVAVLPEAAVDV